MKRQITSNVLGDISKRLQGNVSDSSNRAIVVFNGSVEGLEEKIKYARDLKTKGITISLAFSFMAENILDVNHIVDMIRPSNIYREKDIVNIKAIVDKYQMLICPNLTINTLSKTALGMIDSFIPNLIWSFLYREKKVYMDFSSTKNYLGENTNNKEMLKVIDNYIEIIKKMGAMDIENNISTKILDTNNKNQKVEINTESINKSKVVTERDIIKLPSNQTLTIKKGTIITALAKDKAREKNIEIQIR